MGGQRLRDRLRRFHAARRPGRRPLRPQADVPRRPRPVHPRLAGRRPRPGGLAAAARPRRAGPRRGGPRTLHAHPADGRGAGGARPGAGHRDLGRGGSGRRRRGRTRRRGAGGRAVLALGAADQRAGGRGGAGRLGALAHREPGRGRTAPGPAGCAAGHGGPRHTGVRHLAHPGDRLDVRGHPGAAGRRGAADRAVPADRGAHRGPADAARTAAAARGRVGQRGDAGVRFGDVLHVVLHDAVRAERPRLLPAGGRRRAGAQLPRGGPRLQAGAAPDADGGPVRRGGAGHAGGGGRVRLAVDDERARGVRHRDHVPRHPDDARRRPGDDPAGRAGHLGRGERRGGRRLRPDQHIPHHGRFAGPRGDVDGRRDRHRQRHRPAVPDRGLRPGLPRLRGRPAGRGAADAAVAAAPPGAQVTAVHSHPCCRASRTASARLRVPVLPMADDR
ncbi:Uncharacterized MFS-type transporter [Streptomyces misionensis JCM 4497]